MVPRQPLSKDPNTNNRGAPFVTPLKKCKIDLVVSRDFSGQGKLSTRSEPKAHKPIKVSLVNRAANNKTPVQR